MDEIKKSFEDELKKIIIPNENISSILIKEGEHIKEMGEMLKLK